MSSLTRSKHQGRNGDVILSDFSLPSIQEARHRLKDNGRLLVPIDESREKMPPESAPTPPGFVFETFRMVEGHRHAVFCKSQSDSLRGWAKALDSEASATISPLLLSELQATMAERYERLGREGLISIPVKSTGGREVLADPAGAVAGINSDSLFVFIEPISRDSSLSRWRGKVNGGKLKDKVEAIIGEAPPEKFIVTVQPFYNIRYNANVIVHENGEMIAEFSSGDDLPSRMGAKILFAARRDSLTDLFSYSTENEAERAVAYSVLQAIPGEGAGRGRQFRPGYYEVAVADGNDCGGILPLFFDYRTDPFFTGERRPQAINGD